MLSAPHGLITPDRITNHTCRTPAPSQCYSSQTYKHQPSGGNSLKTKLFQPSNVFLLYFLFIYFFLRGSTEKMFLRGNVRFSMEADKRLSICEWYDCDREGVCSSHSAIMVWMASFQPVSAQAPGFFCFIFCLLLLPPSKKTLLQCIIFFKHLVLLLVINHLDCAYFRTDVESHPGRGVSFVHIAHRQTSADQICGKGKSLRKFALSSGLSTGGQASAHVGISSC